MMLCPSEAAEKVVFFGENDFNIFAPGYTFMGNALAAEGMLLPDAWAGAKTDLSTTLRSR
jgi:hypothetical protein